MWQEFVSTATTANSLCCVLQVYYFSPKALLCFAFSLNQMLPSIASPDKELDSQMGSFCLLLFYVRFYHERQCQSLLWLLLYWALPLTTSPKKGLDSQMRRGVALHQWPPHLTAAVISNTNTNTNTKTHTNTNTNLNTRLDLRRGELNCTSDHPFNCYCWRILLSFQTDE